MPPPLDLTKIVKPLSWDDWSTRNRLVVAAHTSSGVYRITERHFPEGMFTLEMPSNDAKNYATLGDAQAAANADHAARVIAALDADLIAEMIDLIDEDANGFGHPVRSRAILARLGVTP